jgi:hypothetical protein
MKYNYCGNNLDELTNNTTIQNHVMIDNNRPLIITQILPYCSMCGGTGRCGGSCNG